MSVLHQTFALFILLIITVNARRDQKQGERKHEDTYFLHRVATIAGLNATDNKQIEKCILGLEKIPTNCQIWMSDMFTRFLPYLYLPYSNFSLHEVLTWALDRYDGLMQLCDENCYNLTLVYTWKTCTKDLPIQNFFPTMTSETFRDFARDLGTLLCHTNPAGDSCLKHESEILTGRVELEVSLAERCYIKNHTSNEPILPDGCFGQCRLYLQRLIGDYGCCLSSWLVMEDYKPYLSSIIRLYPEKLYKLAKFCGVEPPAGCPVLPDTTTLSTTLIVFLSIASGVALVAIIIGIVKNFRDD